MSKNKKHFKHKYTQKQQNNNNNNSNEIHDNTESIIEQLLLIRQLFEKTKQRLREQDHNYGYLLSTKWLRRWKSYTGYDALEKNQSPQESQKFGKEKPNSKINQNLIAKYEKKFVKIPQSLPQFDYLNYHIDEECSNQLDFIVIDVQLWTAFQSKYPQAMCVRRPLRKRKSGQPFVDTDMHEFNFMIVDEQSIYQCKTLTQQQIFSKNKKQDALSDIFICKKLRVPSIWNLTDLELFLKKFLPWYLNTDQVSQIQFWKFQNYLSFGEARQNICSFFREQDVGVLANHLNAKQINNDLFEVFKTSSLILIVCGNIEILRKEPSKIPEGYCEKCVQDGLLQIKCLCGQVFYCSKKCFYDDKAYHFKMCQLSFDSDDDEQYKIKTIQIDTKQICSGLQNFGNTCYMNSSLQCLLNLQWFSNYFSNNEYINYLNQKQIKQNKGIFIHKFAKFIKKLNEDQHNSPYSLKAQVSYFMGAFKGYNQHDANDFIISLFNNLNDYTTKQQTFGKFILNNLIGHFKSTVKCPSCKIKSVTDDVYLQVSLPIKSKTITKQMQYVKIIDWKTYQKGKLVVSNWNQIASQIKQQNTTRKFIVNQTNQLKQINQQSIEQIYSKYKKHKIVFYSYLKPLVNRMQIKFLLAYSQLIAGNQMKTVYGYPIIYQIDVKTNICYVYKFVAEMLSRDKQYITEIEQLINQLEIQIRQCQSKYKQKEEISQDLIQTSQQILQNQRSKCCQKQQNTQKQMNQQISKIQQKYTQLILSFRNKLNFRLVISNSRKVKNVCNYCKNKCSLCILPFSINTVQDFQKIGQSKLQIEILLDQKIDIVESYQKSPNHNQNITLQECLEQFSKPQILDEENAWYCEKCDMMRLAQKQLQISQYPKTLMVHLKRFKQQNGKKVKNNEIVSYPEVLEIPNQNLKYQLSSVVVHEGSLEGGHYWALCRKGDQYFIFNDSEFKKVEKWFQKGAYIIFYEQILS